MSARKTLAVLIDHLDPMVGGYAGQLRAAFDAECKKLDHDLFIVVGRSLGGPTAAELAQNSAYDLISHDSVDGVILVSGGLASYAGAARMAGFCERFRPLPLCSVGLQIPGVPSIIIDPRPGMWDLIDHLVRVHGRSRIAFVGGPRKNPEAEARAQLYIECLKHHSIVVDPDLIEHATFTLLGGEQAASKILSRKAPPDAIVAASDAIALGAIKAAHARGLKVPSDVIITGFDDLAFARFSSPPLTTIRQPLARMAALAVRSIHAQLQGLRSSRSTELPVELSVRDSCGCGERGAEAPPNSNRVVMHPADYLEAHASRIQAEITSRIELPRDDEVNWAEGLMQGLKLELAGDRGAFASCLDELLSAVDAELQLYDELQKLVTQLRESLAAVGSPALEEVWHAARRSIARANSQGHARLRQELDLAYQHLLHTGERFASASDLIQLKQVMADELPHANVRDALVLLYGDETRRTLVPLFCLRNGEAVELPAHSYPARELLPASAPRSQERTTDFVLPLTFGGEPLGVAVFGARTGIHEMLRVQISVALKTANLQQRLEAANQSAPEYLGPKASKRLNQLSLLLGTVAKELERAAEELSVSDEATEHDATDD